MILNTSPWLSNLHYLVGVNDFSVTRIVHSKDISALPLKIRMKALSWCLCLKNSPVILLIKSFIGILLTHAIFTHMIYLDPNVMVEGICANNLSHQYPWSFGPSKMTIVLISLKIWFVWAGNYTTRTLPGLPQPGHPQPGRPQPGQDITRTAYNPDRT